MAFSPDGTLLASSSSDKTVKLWDVSTGHEVFTFTGHTGEVHSVAFSPDGQWLASGSYDGTIKLWDVGTGHEMRTLIGHTDWIWVVTFSPDGRLLASGSRDRMIKLWEVTTGREVLTLVGQADLVMSLAFSPDGKLLASGSCKRNPLSDECLGQIKLWEVTTGHNVLTLTGHNGYVRAVAFSPDGLLLASGSSDTIGIWNVGTGQNVRMLKADIVVCKDGGEAQAFSAFAQALRGPSEGVWSLAFSSDGKYLVTGSQGTGNFGPRQPEIKLWDVSTGKEILVLTGHTQDVKSVSLSPDSKLLASGSSDKTIKLWYLNDLKAGGSPLDCPR